MSGPRRIGAEIVYTDGRRLRFLPSPTAEADDWVRAHVDGGWIHISIVTGRGNSGTRRAVPVARYPWRDVDYVYDVWDGEPGDTTYEQMVMM